MRLICLLSQRARLRICWENAPKLRCRLHEVQIRLICLFSQRARLRIYRSHRCWCCNAPCMQHPLRWWIFWTRSALGCRSAEKGFQAEMKSCTLHTKETYLFVLTASKIADLFHECFKAAIDTSNTVLPEIKRRCVPSNTVLPKIKKRCVLNTNRGKKGHWFRSANLSLVIIVTCIWFDAFTHHFHCWLLILYLPWPSSIMLQIQDSKDPLSDVTLLAVQQMFVHRIQCCSFGCGWLEHFCVDLLSRYFSKSI